VEQDGIGGAEAENPHRQSNRDTVSPAPADGRWFSTYYRITSSGERIQVLQCLVAIQVEKLSRLVENLKARIGNRLGPAMLLVEAENRIQRARSMRPAMMGAGNPVAFPSSSPPHAMVRHY
jgi:hypothetical protein